MPRSGTVTRATGQRFDPMTDSDRPDATDAVNRALDALLDAQHALSYVRFNVDARHAREAIERAERHLERLADPPDPAA